jgi:hypothetical protein
MPYLTRMSWNSLDWTKPSGISNKCAGRGINYNLFECENGFAWEEWNFKFNEHIDSYCYGYLECFNNKKKSKIEIYKELHIYTRKCEKNCQKNSKSICFYLGYFKELEVLSVKENETIIEIIKNNLNLLSESLRSINIKNSKDLITSKGDAMHNIRFKRENLIRPKRKIEECQITIPHPFYKFLKYNVSEKPDFLNQINNIKVQ